MNYNYDTDIIIKKLNGTLKKQRLIRFISGLLALFVSLMILWIILSILASLFILPVAMKLSLLVISILFLVYFFFKFSIKKLFEGNIEKTAIKLENRFPEIKGLLIGAIQFSKMKRDPGFSKELILATQERAIKKTNEIDFNDILRYYPIIKTGRYLLSVTILSMLISFLAPGFFDYSYKVYSNPTTLITHPLGYNLTTFPGSIKWIKYREIEIGGVLVGENIPKKAVINILPVDGNWQKKEIDISTLNSYRVQDKDSVYFSINYKKTDKSFDYYIEAGNLRSETYKIDVVDRPRVTGIKLSIFYPSYTGLSPLIIDENNGSFSALIGSKVKWELDTNIPIASADIVFSENEIIPLKVNNRSIEITSMIHNSKAYYFRLLDNLGEDNPDPIEYYITAVPDEFPSIDVISPGYDVNLNDEMILPVKLRIFDDYGFTSLAMKYEIISEFHDSGENIAMIHFPENIKTEGEIGFNWDLDPFSLYPGDYVFYYFEIADNDRINGPKISQSKKYIARLPSLDEIITEINDESRSQVSETEEILKQGKDLSERLKNLSRKIEAEKNSELSSDWQNKKELQSIIENNENVIDRIDEISNNIEQSLEKLNENSLISREIMEKMIQIQKLFEEVATPEMKEAQRKLMEALQNMKSEDFDEALKEFQLGQQELLDRLEQTLSLLKKLQMEQAMESMLRQAEDLADKQEKLNERVDSSSVDNLPSISKQENKLKNQFDNMRQNSENLDQIADQLKLKDSYEYKSFKDAIEQSKSGEHMNNMSQQLEAKNKSIALEQGNKAHDELMKMLSEMQNQMSALMGANQSEIEQSFKKAIEDSNLLSDNQEKLFEELSQTPAQSDLMQKLTERQQNLERASQSLKGQISELGKKSPFLSTELGNVVQNSISNMKKAVNSLIENQISESQMYQRDAMSDMNKTTLKLMETLKRQKQLGQGSASGDASQMETLAKQQKQLNQKTQDQFNNPGGQFNDPISNRNSLKRLAGEQESIRKSIEQLTQEFNESRKILGRLDDISKEMKKVEEALLGGSTKDEITKKQLKILTRMLDASRSLYMKNYSDQREAMSATEQPVYLPPGLKEYLLDDTIDIEDRLRKYLGNNYPRQYEQQIKAYFKALLEMERKK